MPLAALVMMMVVLPLMLSGMVVAILWPGALARLNAAALRTFPVAAPRSMREQAASRSTPGTLRFTGIVGLGIVLAVGSGVTRTVLDEGIVESDTRASSWMVWLICAIGLAQAIVGISLIVRSRLIFERLRVTFHHDGAGLRRWMIIVLGSVGLALAATSLFVAVSLS